MRRTAVIVAAAVVVVGAIVAVALLERSPPGTAEGFLESYVEEDGRVVRRDQGDDTVSEGQAYALLLAVAEGDEERFARVWAWTRRHLRRDDGLLAWRWAAGHVVDDEPATDADLDAARALVLAGERFDEPRYAGQGRALARAITRHGTAWAADRSVLVAGVWAREPAVVNPSYWSPRAYRLLEFEQVAESSRVLTERLLENGLPPDWARVGPTGITPSAPPSGDGEAVYSYDAARVPIRLAESCDDRDRALAAGLWERLRDRPGAARRALDGTPLTEDEHPVALVGAAAAAHAAGDREAAARLLDEAERLDAEHPTYYGSAWVALGRAMLEQNTLGVC